LPSSRDLHEKSIIVKFVNTFVIGDNEETYSTVKLAERAGLEGRSGRVMLGRLMTVT